MNIKIDLHKANEKTEMKRPKKPKEKGKRGTSALSPKRLQAKY